MKKIDMCHGPIFSSMVRFAIPILLTNLLQQLINAVDVILAGRLGTSGSDAIAAVGSTTAITSLLINFFIGCSTGSAVTVAHALGSKNGKEIKQTVHTAMLLAVVLGLILTVVGIVFSQGILKLIGTPENIIKQSAAYLRTYFFGMVFYMVYNFGAAILRAVGETKKPLYFLMVSGPAKLVLTIVFVVVLELDIIGLALATASSQAISAILVVITLIKRNDECKLCLKALKFSKGPLKKILRLGIPSGIQSATFSMANVVIQSSVNSLSNIPGFITGNAAASNILTFADILTGVFYNCSLNFTGQNIGARNYDRVKRVYITASIISTVTIAVVSVFVCIFPAELLGIYIIDSPEAIRWGALRLTILFIPMVLQGLMDVTSGALRGMGISISNTIIALFGICGFRILWCLTIFKMPQFHTPQILFSCYPITWFVTFIAQLIIFISVYKKQKQKTEQTLKSTE